MEFEQDRATQNYPVTLLCRNTTEGGGEPFAERAEEGGEGGFPKEEEEEAKKLFYTPESLDNPVFHKKNFFFFSFSRRSL